MVLQTQRLFGAVWLVSAHHAVRHAAGDLLAVVQQDASVRYRNIWVRRLTGYDQAAK